MSLTIQNIFHSKKKKNIEYYVDVKWWFSLNISQRIQVGNEQESSVTV